MPANLTEPSDRNADAYANVDACRRGGGRRQHDKTECTPTILLFISLLPAHSNVCNICATLLSEELRWIAGELGAARDWEVLAGATLHAAFDGAPVDIHADPITLAARDMAKQNRTRAAAAVESVRYARLFIELARWIDQAAWREGPDEAPLTALGRTTGRFAGSTLG